MPRRSRRAAGLAVTALQMQAATLTVLGIRVPTLLDGSASTSERSRMVREKGEAAVESAQAVSRAAVRLAGRPMSPTGLMSAWLALGEAAMRPYHKRVTGNAKRLSRKPRSG